MSETAHRFGKMLRKMRLSRGLSQLELASRAGLSENAISAFERAERFPRATTMDALTHALKTDVDVILGDVLKLREEPIHEDETQNALRQLATLLMDRPEGQVRMALDVCQRVIQEIEVAQA